MPSNAFRRVGAAEWLEPGGKLLLLGSPFMLDRNMAKLINVRPKKRGRPATERAPIIGVRLPDDLLLDLDQWAVDHELSRSAAIRRLLERALRVPAKKS
jgi:hypothetical protein